MSVVLDCANVVLKDKEGNSGLVRSLTDNDVSKINTGLSDIADLKARVKTVEDNGYISYNSLQTLDGEQCSQAQANMDAPGLSANNTFTGKMTVEADVKADSFTLNTRSDYAKLSASTDTYGVKVLGGSTETTGANIILNGATDTDTDVANSFNVVAKDNVKLHGAPDGTLTWNSANIVRAVNNVPADAKGNVLLGTEKSTFNKITFETDYFTIGTNTTTAFDLTGTDLELIDKERINIRILAKVTTAHAGFKVGDIAQLTSGVDHAATSGDLDVCTYIRNNVIYLYSGSNIGLSVRTTTEWMHKDYVELKLVLTAFIPDDGSILLIAEDQEKSCSLVGLPDGTLTWGGAPIVPTGSLFPFAGTVVPDGYLLCNGAAVSRTDYSRLFDVIGTTYGSGDGSTTFNLPNFSDRFIEGTTSTSSVGTLLSAGLPNITGEAQWAYIGYTDWSEYSGAFGYNPDVAPMPGETSATNSRIAGYPLTFDASKSNSIYGNSSTVQPSSTYTLIIIKV